MARRIAERVYATLPACSQNLALSIFGLKYRWERLGGGFRTYVREYEMRERWDPEQLHLYSQDRLRMILRSAFRASHYRSLWEDAGLQEGDIDGFHLEDLTRLPLTNKEQLRSNPLDFVTHPTKHPRYLIEQQTSGSTGIPVKIFKSLEAEGDCGSEERRSFSGLVSAFVCCDTIGARAIIPPQCPPPSIDTTWWRTIPLLIPHLPATSLTTSKALTGFGHVQRNGASTPMSDAVGTATNYSHGRPY